MGTINFENNMVSGFQAHTTINESETRNWFNEDGVNNPFGSSYINPYDKSLNEGVSRRDPNYPGTSFGFVEPTLDGGTNYTNCTMSSFYGNTDISNFITHPIDACTCGDMTNQPQLFADSQTTLTTQTPPMGNISNGLNSIIESRRNVGAINNNGNTNPWADKSNNVNIMNTSVAQQSSHFTNSYMVKDPYDFGKINFIDDSKKGINGRWLDSPINQRTPLPQPNVDWNNSSIENSVCKLNDETINKNSTWSEIADRNFKK